MPRMSFNDQKNYRDHSFLTLSKGDVFGEDKLFYKTPNRYTAQVQSRKCVVLTIQINFFYQYYKKSMKKLKEVFDLRNIFAEQMIAK
jgi:CRP-like cAMP-binding protein